MVAAPRGGAAGLGAARRPADALGFDLIKKHQRVVGDGVGFPNEHERGMAQLVEAGADDLRLAAQAVRILDAVARRMRRANRAPFEQPAIDGGGIRLPRWPRSAWMRASNGTSLARHASTDIAPATTAAASARSAANSPPSASAVDTCVPLRSASPSFGASLSGESPA